MGHTAAQRQEIDDMENLAAGLDFLDRLLQRLAQAARDPYTLEQLADGRQRLAIMHQIVVRRRQALRDAARRTGRARSSDTDSEASERHSEGDSDASDAA